MKAPNLPRKATGLILSFNAWQSKNVPRATTQEEVIARQSGVDSCRLFICRHLSLDRRPRERHATQ
jgi:hypothetical protein